MSRRPPRQLSLLEPGMRIKSATGRWAVVAPGVAGKLAVTERGTVYSTRSGKRVRGRLVKYRSSKTGELIRHPYRVVGYRDELGRTRQIEIHRLVAWTFLGEPPRTESGKAWEVHHKDTNHRNNRLSNLVYLEPADHGTVTRAANGSTPRRMTQAEVDEFMDMTG